MVNFCAVFGCFNRSNRNTEESFYRLPAIKKNVSDSVKALQKERRALWLRRSRRADLTAEKHIHVRICSDHFVSGKPTPLSQKDSTDWAPSLNLGYSSNVNRNPDRENRRKSREQERERREGAAALISLNESEAEYFQEELTQDVGSQTDQNGDVLKAQEAELKALRQERNELSKKLKEASLTEDTFQGDDEKVLYYTGLPDWSTLNAVFTLVKSYIPPSSKCPLSSFQRFILTLMRIRLGLNGKDIAYRFGIHESTVSRIFQQVIDVMYNRLSGLIIWPRRDVLKKTMPMDFRKHCPNCVVIIDCFEIFLERPMNVLARAQTYSSYKHHNTIKYLIGITPQGTVSFISNGWGGRVSDKNLTENSGLLKNLIPGDVILADRGFEIQESVGLYLSTISIPAFTKGKTQLSGIDIEQTRCIANVRIHVERVTGNLRQKYAILSQTQPTQYVTARTNQKTILDKIITVGCALINICGSVVPSD